MRRHALGLVALAALAGCGTTEPPRHVVGDAFYRLDTVAPSPDDALRGPAEGEVLAYRIRLSFREQFPLRADLQSPEMTVFPRQLGNVTVATQTAFVQTFETEVVEDAFVADPVIGMLHTGLQVEVAAAPASDGSGRIVLAYHAYAAETAEPLPQADFPIGPSPVTIQLPALERAFATGVRRLEPGVTSLIAEMPKPGGGTVKVFVSATPVGMPATDAPPGELPDFALERSEDRGPAVKDVLRAAEAGPAPRGRLKLRLATLGRELPLGVALERPDESLPFEVLMISTRTHGLVGTFSPGVRVAGLLDESYLSDFEVKSAGTTSVANPVVAVHSSGLVAEVVEQGRLRIRWTTTPSWETVSHTVPGGGEALLDRPRTRTHETEVSLAPGTRLVPLARLAGGGTVAVLLTFEPDAASGASAPGLLPSDHRRTAHLAGRIR
jgi:hypothetical protein